MCSNGNGNEVDCMWVSCQLAIHIREVVLMQFSMQLLENHFMGGEWVVVGSAIVNASVGASAFLNIPKTRMTMIE